MKNWRKLLLTALMLLVGASWASAAVGHSVYTQRPDDPDAFYFTPENYNFKADGKSDVTVALQTALNQVKKERNFGVLFLPEGKYRLSGTVMIPSGIRLIGYGKTRPILYVAPNTPAFAHERTPMIWFTGGGVVTDVTKAQDANAGTFYSAVSNVDFQIGKNNPQAVAMRCHVAQHSFINHSDIHAEGGLAGIWDVGNELEDVNIFGGVYGILTQRASPGWPVMVVDVCCEGQQRAAICTQEAGLAIVNLQVKKTPIALEMTEKVDRLYIENSVFEDVTDTAIKVEISDNTFAQLNLKDIICKNVPVLVKYQDEGTQVKAPAAMYRVDEYVKGLQLSGMDAVGQFAETSRILPLQKWESRPAATLPQLPAMEEWVNVRTLGAVGDGETDDTEAFEKAIAQHRTIYVPQGWYRLSRTLKLKEGTRLIGLHPFGTQFVLKESEAGFSGFGAPVPLVESSKGGDDMINGIGIFTGAYNYRAAGLKWMAGARSFLNDVKFVGGHGTMQKPGKAQNQGTYGRNSGPQVSTPANPVFARGKDNAWDNQYWSLWVTDGGGGTLKDIWTADTYAASGLYVSHTQTPGRIYAMSLEHHVRTEARFNNVANWKIYAFQFEEETVEGPDDHMAELSECRNMEFINVWMYRVIKVKTPKEIGFRVWDCQDVVFRNMHNYTQILPVIEYPLYDMNRHLPVAAWDFAYLNITGKETPRTAQKGLFEPQRVVTGFELAAGATADSQGNLFFGENRLKKIYKWNADNQAVSLYADYPWKPFTMVTDTQDNLVVICRYDPQPGLMVNGQQEGAPKLPDDNPMYSSWGNGGWSTFAYAIRPGKGDDMVPLKRVNSADVRNARYVVHPASRWRGDYETIVEAMAPTSFMAPDGVTQIPETYDLGRSCALIKVAPGQSSPVFVVNENNKTTRRYQVRADGTLQDAGQVCAFGQYSDVTDAQGNLYVADGDIYVYNAQGQPVRTIRMDERPISLCIAGKSQEWLFVTTTESLYKIRIK